MTKVILTRHGHVEGISPERFRGRTDVPLTELGTTQAESLAARISAEWRPRAVYTSPMTRCVATGARIAKRCGVAAQVLEDLNDLVYGHWTWRTPEEVAAAWPESAGQVVRHATADALPGRGVAPGSGGPIGALPSSRAQSTRSTLSADKSTCFASTIRATRVSALLVSGDGEIH